MDCWYECEFTADPLQSPFTCKNHLTLLPLCRWEAQTSRNCKWPHFNHREPKFHYSVAVAWIILLSRAPGCLQEVLSMSLKLYSFLKSALKTKNNVYTSTIKLVNTFFITSYTLKTSARVSLVNSSNSSSPVCGKFWTFTVWNHSNIYIQDRYIPRGSDNDVPIKSGRLLAFF